MSEVKKNNNDYYVEKKQAADTAHKNIETQAALNQQLDQINTELLQLQLVQTNAKLGLARQHNDTLKQLVQYAYLSNLENFDKAAFQNMFEVILDDDFTDKQKLKKLEDMTNQFILDNIFKSEDEEADNDSNVSNQFRVNTPIQKEQSDKWGNAFKVEMPKEFKK